MSALEDPDPHPAKFTRRSETGSTCNFCFVTLKAGRYIPIENGSGNPFRFVFAKARVSG